MEDCEKEIANPRIRVKLVLVIQYFMRYQTDKTYIKAVCFLKEEYINKDVIPNKINETPLTLAGV